MKALLIPIFLMFSSCLWWGCEQKPEKILPDCVIVVNPRCNPSDVDSVVNSFAKNTSLLMGGCNDVFGRKFGDTLFISSRHDAEQRIRTRYATQTVKTKVIDSTTKDEIIYGFEKLLKDITADRDRLYELVINLQFREKCYQDILIQYEEHRQVPDTIVYIYPIDSI
jgi:hypothetical protein